MARSLNKFGLVGLIFLLLAGTLFFLLRREPPTLFINEFMADNASCCPYTVSGNNEFDDWIEIYNAGSVPVDIGGMYLSQDKSKPLGHKIGNTDSQVTTIQPGGFLVLWADGDPGQGILHLDFKLDQDGEFLGFYDEHGRTIDSHKFVEQGENISLGRSLDGNDVWKEFSVPTPGRSNR